MGPMTALVTADARTSANDVAPASESWLSRRLARIAEARQRRRLHAELSAMSDAMLLDIGVAEDEIYLIRQGTPVTPRAWVERGHKPRRVIA